MTKVNIESKSALAKLMATENIHVEHKQVPTASFDVKNRILALPMWENMDDVTYEGLIGHEVGHALYTPYEPWAEFVKENPSLKDCANVIEDARIERLMKIKYPGMRGTFFSMYEKLNAKDFFGVKGADLEESNIIDRINLHFKLGSIAGIPFNDAEKVFVEKVAKAETFEDVLALTKELSDMAKEEAEAKYEDGLDFSDVDDMDGDFEMIEMPPMPNNGDADEESEDETEQNGSGGEETDSNEDGDEVEENETTKGNKATETEDSFDGPEVEVPSYSDGAGGEGEVPVPSSETQRNFDSSLQGLNNVEAKEPFYVDLPKVEIGNALVDYKTVGKQLTEFWADPENTRDYWYDNDLRTETMDELRAWKKDTLPVVNYLVKEFEMKQAASAHRRTSTGKTGQLDMNKLHAYKIDEDIFKRVATVKDGRNHGLVMYVDWSGSMHGKMFATIKQTMTLVMFAKKVGIPFRVYSFTNGMRRNEEMKPIMIPENQTADKTLILRDVYFHEYFNEKMTSKEFNKGIENMWFLGKAIERNSMRVPPNYNLASTPLNESIIASYEMVEAFRKETGREKINVIFLTDGGSDGNNEYYDRVEGSPSWFRYDKELYLRDPISKKIVTKGHRNTFQFTSDLLANLGDRCGVNVIGFYITSTREIRQSIDYAAMTWTERDNNRKYLTKNGYIGMTKFGYDKYFMVKDNALDQNADFQDVDRNNDGTVAKGKLRTQFRKFTKARKVNKMMLNEFVAMVA